MIPESLRKILDAQKQKQSKAPEKKEKAVENEEKLERTTMWRDGDACREVPGKPPRYFKVSPW